MQKKLNSVINKLILVAWRKTSGSHNSSYGICALVCLLECGSFFFQGLLLMCCLSRRVKHVIRKCCCLHLGVNGGGYSEQKSRALSWLRWVLAPVLRVHCELQPLKKRIRIKGWKLVGILQQTVLRRPPSLWLEGSYLQTLSMKHTGSGELCLRLLAPILPSLPRSEGCFCGLPSRRHAFKLKLSKCS